MLLVFVDSGSHEFYPGRWHVTLQRKDTAYRAEIKYIGRPVFIAGELPKMPPPPVLSLLDEKVWQL